MLTADCIQRFKDGNGVIIGYRLKDLQGNVKDIKPDTLKQAISQDKIHVTNLTLTSDGRLIHQEVKTNQPEIDNKVSKMEQLKRFEAKQNMVGRIFDFQVDPTLNKIGISKYYDSPNRKEVVIPDFVDELLSHEDKQGKFEYDVGIFFACKYVEKVVMHSNVHGSLEGLFCDSCGSKLDLSEFDTSNITDMTSMFESCNIECIKLGGLFDTHNVISMRFMFCSCYAKSLELGDKFITSKVRDMDSMFATCEAELINLGNFFCTSRVKRMTSMFSWAKTKKLELGNKFDTSKVTSMEEMFQGLELDRLQLGNNFHTHNVKSMESMFESSKIKHLELGNKFDTSNTEEMGFMFNSFETEILDLGPNFYIPNAESSDYIFAEIKTKQIVVSTDIPNKTLDIIKLWTNTPVIYKQSD